MSAVVLRMPTTAKSFAVRTPQRPPHAVRPRATVHTLMRADGHGATANTTLAVRAHANGLIATIAALLPASAADKEAKFNLECARVLLGLLRQDIAQLTADAIPALGAVDA